MFEIMRLRFADLSTWDLHVCIILTAIILKTWINLITWDLNKEKYIQI